METEFIEIERHHAALARERVLADLRALSHDAENLVKATASDVSEKAKEARDRLSSAIERAKTTCNDLQQQTVNAARGAVRKTNAAMREHPYTTVGIAFGVGLIAGLMLGSSCCSKRDGE